MKRRVMTLERQRMRGEGDRQITMSEKENHAVSDTARDGWQIEHSMAPCWSNRQTNKKANFSVQAGIVQRRKQPPLISKNS